MVTFNQKRNKAASKIATVGGINSSDNPVTFNITTGDGSEFPASNFKIAIDNEILFVTTRTGDQFVATRAQESTTAAAHALNADVELVITAGDIEQIQTAIQNSSSIYAVATGSSNAYVLTLDPAPAAYVDGQIFAFRANFANTGAATLNVNGLGAKFLKKINGTLFTDVSVNDLLSGMIVVAQYDSANGYFQIKSQLSNSSGNANFGEIFGPQGFAQNYKIVTSVAGNAITVALKTSTGTDPSVNSPIHIRIGNTIRSITAALSTTKPAASNWMDLGGSELATKEVDLFVYLGYNATDGVVIGFARRPDARIYSDFNTTATDPAYCAINNITSAASTDEYELIGRFNAILSAGAGYTWSLPATSIIVNHPIYETRWLSWAPVYVGFSVNPAASAINYQIKGANLHIIHDANFGTSNTTGFTLTLPYPPKYTGYTGQGVSADNGTYASGSLLTGAANKVITLYPSGLVGAAWTNSGNKTWRVQGLVLPI